MRQLVKYPSQFFFLAMKMRHQGVGHAVGRDNGPWPPLVALLPEACQQHPVAPQDMFPLTALLILEMPASWEYAEKNKFLITDLLVQVQKIFC